MPSKASAPHQAAAAPRFRVALIAAPWHLHGRPSIQLGCLKAYLEKNGAGIQVANFHPYLRVAAQLGPRLYHQIAANMWLCEALFAPLLFSAKKEAAERLAKREARKESISVPAPFAVTRILEKSCSAWCEAIDWSSFDLIGFSVCFHQLLASLFLTRKIKARHPASRIVFGGSSILPGMEEPLRDLAGVDFCISGEGEGPLLTLCRELLAADGTNGETPNHGQLRTLPASTGQLADLDSLPVPDYRDYFAETAAVFGQASLAVSLPVEFSRGCWWNKCAFCNLNLQWQGYRRKSARRMHEEILTLGRRHQVLDFCFTDNCLPLRESRDFFARMTKERRDMEFFAECRQEQAASFEAFQAGGLKEVQVGVEALSTALLARMGKGGKAMDNVYAMKMAVQCGILLQGNLILQFPTSTERERDETLQNLDYVFPYTPLQSASFFLGHSSPVYCGPRNYGIRAITVHPKFAAILPDRLRRLPLLVSGYRGDLLYQRRLWQPVRQKMKIWRQYHRQRGCPAEKRPLLEYRDSGDFLLIRQEDPAGRTLYHRLTRTSRLLYLYCAAPVSLEKICRRFPALHEGEITAFLDELQRKRLVFKEDHRYLALAVRQQRDK